jgi:hypothetical protein
MIVSMMMFKVRRGYAPSLSDEDFNVGAGPEF